MEDTPVHALDYLSVLRRRKWWLIVPIVASIGVGAALVRFLPKQYTASATIAVHRRRASRRTSSARRRRSTTSERIRAVSQQLLSSRVLTRVSRRRRPLGVAGRGACSPDCCRVAVTVSVPTPVDDRRSETPRHVRRLVRRRRSGARAARRQPAGRGVRRRQLEGAAAAGRVHVVVHLGASSRRARCASTSSRRKLRRAKESHIGQLPEQTQANLQTLSGLRQQIDSNATALRGEQDRLSMIERQLEAMTQGGVGRGRRGAAAAPPASRRSAQTPASSRSSASWRPPACRTPTSTRRSCACRTSSPPRGPKPRAITSVRRPIAWRSSRPTRPTGSSSADRETARLRIRELERVEADLRRQIGVYQARVESAPMVEQQLASVQRDYDLEKQQYVELSAKLAAAGIAENVERTRTGEQFSVLYPAAYPAEPTKPMPLRVMLLSIVAGLCLGGAARCSDASTSTAPFTTSASCATSSTCPVLGEVTHIRPADARLAGGCTDWRRDDMSRIQTHSRQGRTRGRPAPHAVDGRHRCGDRAPLDRGLATSCHG